jgi:hypothetical protein
MRTTKSSPLDREALMVRGEAFMLDLLCIAISLFFFIDSALLVHWADRVR